MSTLCLLTAAQLPRISFEELVNGSQFIVHGRVARKWCGWDAKHKYIWTHYELEVAENVRGAMGARVTVSEPGGEIDGIGQSFGGALPYAAGEEVVLFLDRTPIGFLRTVGGGQGKFTVGSGGQARANLAGVELVDLPGARKGTPLSSVDGVDVRELKRRARGTAALYPYRAREPRP
jgi:hypothetical protein